jgi:hypothetical protein
MTTEKEAFTVNPAKFQGKFFFFGFEYILGGKLVVFVGGMVGLGGREMIYGLMIRRVWTFMGMGSFWGGLRRSWRGSISLG